MPMLSTLLFALSSNVFVSADVTSVMQCLNCSDFLFTDFLVRLLKYDPGKRVSLSDLGKFVSSEYETGFGSIRSVSRMKSN